MHSWWVVSILAGSLLTGTAAAQYTIRTVAGGGPPDGAPALDVSIGAVSSIAVSPGGDVYVASTVLHRVFRVSPSGTVFVVAGNGSYGYSGDGGPAASASLYYPSGLAFDAPGNLYIAEFYNNRVRKVSTTGIITTVAGNGNAGYSGDGGTATGASLNHPSGLAVDAAGNLYIADTGNRRVRKVSTSGVITTVAGNGASGDSGDGGPATNASFTPPEDIAVDTTGNLFIATPATNRIRKVSPAGVITTAYNNGVNFRPMGLSVDGAGSLYIADPTSQRIWKLLAQGSIITVAAALTYPSDVATDNAGNIYIAESLVIRKVSAGGVMTTIAGNGAVSNSGDGKMATAAQLREPSGVAIDSTGVVYISDRGSNRIRKVSTDGTITTVAGDGRGLFAGDGGLAVNASLDHPGGLALDSSGNLYIADSFNNRVRRVSPNGLITTVAGNGSESFGGDGGLATNASIYNPVGLAIDPDGNLYVTDQNHRIRQVSPNGIITTVAGDGRHAFAGDGGAATSAALYSPYGVALDTTGNLYIADTVNQRIRKVSPQGIITTVAGNGAYSYSGDGGPATNASFRHPSDIVVDHEGNLYVSDSGNSRIRKFSPGGVITTVAGNGAAGYSGDGGPSTEASISSPAGLALRGAGALYFSDRLNFRVRSLTLALAPQPAFLAFTYQTGSIVPSPQTITLNSGGATIHAAAATNSSSGWLTVSPSSAASPATFTVSVDPAGLSPGVYHGTIQLTIAGGGVTTAPVSLNVLPFCTYALSHSSAYLPATGTTATFNVIANEGCPWTTGQPESWITITSVKSGSGPGTVTFQVAPNPFSSAPRTGTITVGVLNFFVTQSAAFGFTSGLRFVPVVPCRAVDTRLPTGVMGGPRLNGNQSRSFPLPAGNCGIPPNALAYSLNVTVVPAGPLGYLTLWPTGQIQPLVSTLNSFDGRIKANAAIVPSGANGAVSVFVTDPSDVVLDVNGYFVSSLTQGLFFHSVTPCRIVDTRLSTGAFGGPSLAAGQTRSFPIPSSGCAIPSTASAYSLNFTAVPSGPLGYLTTWPAGSPQPFVSTLNAPTGTVTANAAIVPSGTNGAINVYATNNTDLVIDINGYFGPPSPSAQTFFIAAPCRISDTRLPNGLLGGPVVMAGETRGIPASMSSCGIPSLSKALSVNATVVPAGPLTFLSMWPGGARPLVSTLNSFDGTVTANAAIVPAFGGSFGVFVSDQTHVILDINGYFF